MVTKRKGAGTRSDDKFGGEGVDKLSLSPNFGVEVESKVELVEKGD